MVLAAPVKDTVPVPDSVPPLLVQLPLTVMVLVPAEYVPPLKVTFVAFMLKLLAPALSVPCTTVRVATVVAAASVAVPLALLMVRLL